MDRGQASDASIENAVLSEGSGNARTSEIRPKWAAEGERSEPGDQVHLEEVGPLEDLLDEATRIDYHTFDRFHGIERAETAKAERPSWRPPPPGSLRAQNRVKKPTAAVTELPLPPARPSSPPPPLPRKPTGVEPKGAEEWSLDDLQFSPPPGFTLEPLPATVTSLLARSTGAPAPTSAPPVGPTAAPEFFSPPPRSEAPTLPPTEDAIANEVTRLPAPDPSAMATRPWPEVPPPQKPWEEFRDRALGLLARGLRTLADQIETFL